jgi:MEMO1 family protein
MEPGIGKIIFSMSHPNKKFIIISGLSFLTGLIVLSLIYILICPKQIEISKQYKLNKNFQNAMQFDKKFYEDAFSFTKDEKFPEQNIIGAIAPHHLLAADLIAKIFQGLSGQKYDSIILLSPNHFLAGQAKIITTKEDWQTPFGILKNDNEISDELLKDNDVKVENDVFTREHGIYSEIGFIKRTFPDVKIVPLVLRPSVTDEDATQLADIFLKIRMNKKILVLVSADFSHNTDSLTAIKNNKESLKIINDFDFSQFSKITVDTPPSIYTILKYASNNKSQFKLIDDSNSEILSGQKKLDNVTSYITGYFYANGSTEN